MTWRGSLSLGAAIAALAGAQSARAQVPLQPLAPAVLQRLAARQPARVQALKAALEARLVPQHGLAPGAGLAVASASTDAFGQTHVRFDQTHRGVRVWGGRAVGRMDAAGRVLATTAATLHADVAVDPTPTLSADAARAAVEAHVRRSRGLAGARATPSTAELVVLPTVHQGGLRLALDPTGRVRLDATRSVATRRLTEPSALGWLVRTLLVDARQGFVATDAIVHAHTGELLKVWDAAQHAEAPAVGTGHGEYNGTVPLSTTRLDDGTYELRDTTRATRPHPWVAEFPENGVTAPGSQVLSFAGPFEPAFGRTYLDADNTWGDGLPRLPWPDGAPDSENGQTAAADVHYGHAVAWDFYRDVFGRDGIDGQGTSTLGIVHFYDFDLPWANAAWLDRDYLMLYGFGRPGERIASSVTSLDVAAHEMSHGVMSRTANLEYVGESGGPNEANSDILGTMVEFYARGAGGQGATIPDTGGDWTIGEQLRPGGLRDMRRPSADGWSYDAWFDGVGMADVHFSSGIGNRFFYFLARGTGGHPDAHSPYLPQGMAGLGNARAARIWYRAVTAHMTDVRTDYAQARAATLAAARELHGAGSAEERAVADAWAAVNVGAAWGAGEPVRVLRPVDAGNPGGGERDVFVAPGATVPLRMAVHNARDTSLTWEVGGLQGYTPYVGGRVTPEGDFTAPFRFDQGYLVKATSREDPRQFAVALVGVFNVDTDNDAQVDAADMGTLGMWWEPERTIAPDDGADVYPDAVADDVDVAVFLATFRNSYR